jgi:hypothetical protein
MTKQNQYLILKKHCSHLRKNIRKNITAVNKTSSSMRFLRIPSIIFRPEKYDGDTIKKDVFCGIVSRPRKNYKLDLAKQTITPSFVELSCLFHSLLGSRFSFTNLAKCTIIFTVSLTTRKYTQNE